MALMRKCAERRRCHPSFGTYCTFVCEKEDQGKGIGKQIFHALCGYAAQTFHVTKITVNAAPGSVEAYRHFGMRDVASEQVRDGIRFIPLEMWITPAAPKKDHKKLYLIIGAAVLCLAVFVLLSCGSVPGGRQCSDKPVPIRRLAGRRRGFL